MSAPAKYLITGCVLALTLPLAAQTNQPPKVPLWTPESGKKLVTVGRREAWITLKDGRKVQVSLPILVEKPARP